MDLPDPPELRDVLEFYGIMPYNMVICPFHEEANASMSCNYEKNVYYCHACGAKGNSWTFIMNKEGVDFRGARDFAAAKSLSAGTVRGGNESVSGLSYTSRGAKRGVGLPARPGSARGDHSYKPSWRRR